MEALGEHTVLLSDGSELPADVVVYATGYDREPATKMLPEEIAHKVGNLRATLVRVIRTSTADVDRRGAPRVSLNRPGTIRWQGRSARVNVRDISTGGAMIAENIADMAVDAPVTLVIEGIAAELDGKVARKSATTTLLFFNLSEQAAGVVANVITPRLAA